MRGEIIEGLAGNNTIAPYTPTAAKTDANKAKTPNIIVENRWRTTDTQANPASCEPAPAVTPNKRLASDFGKHAQKNAPL
ncbi:MAG TPA: hypothetical protein VHZ55_26715 [Bryobacteraceae bacterium]|nr:hypothetical protein [Bryobacteraceae bacterium]